MTYEAESILKDAWSVCHRNLLTLTFDYRECRVCVLCENIIYYQRLVAVL